ncbi:putative bifunctional diguanylate cyclase/phosphodiesterase [Marinomonas gallaica]|uniref:putative bifunctional diguanylate cyclase/phosphodiesterase n=1 Tax=Marinomonas gallaica TaxID=1806667 RepID=UPI003CE49039
MMFFNKMNLSVRFTLTIIVLLGIFGLGISLLIRSLSNIELLLEQQSALHIQELSSNSAISREIFELSSRVQLLEQKFLYDEEILSEEGFNIDEQLQRIRALSNDQSFVIKMDDFIVDFHRFLGNSVTLNRILKQLSVTDKLLGHQIDQLDFALARTSIEQLSANANTESRNDLEVMHQIRESYLSAGKLAASVRSSITPDTEQVVIIEVLKELHILEMHLSNMRELSDVIIESKYAMLDTIKHYRINLRKMTANLNQRWIVMSALVNAQNSLISYVQETEENVQRSALRLSNELRNDLTIMRGWVFMIGLFSLIIGIILILFMVRHHITKPLNQLKQSFKEIETNNFDNPINLNRKDEWDVIESAFNRMASRLKKTYRDLENERSKLHELAHQDPLTGLANRLLIYKSIDTAISEAKRSHQHFALLYLDIDHFKTVNDSMGHSAGDVLLQEVSQRLSNLVEPSDMVSRLGGDEFMILVHSTQNITEASMLAEAVNEALRQPFLIDNETVFVGSSVGVCLYPEHGDSAETLVRNADTAMYHAKRGGRDSHCIYKDAMTSEAHNLMSKSSGLKQALLNNELFVQYQPQYDSFTGDIYGAEALVRWNHPSKGILLPGDFLDIAEQTGIIVDIDDYVFDIVFNDLQELKQQGLVSKDFSLSVNVSGRKLLSEHLLEHLKICYEQAPEITSRMILELTERDMITKLDQSSDFISQLKKLGFKIAIDDFGTGYSSLATLKHLPVDILKLDRSFVSGLDSEGVDHVIIDSILSVAHGLGLSAIAEGVETPQQLEALKTLGCQTVQGYLLSYPINRDELIKLLIEQSPPSLPLE